MPIALAEPALRRRLRLTTPGVDEQSLIDGVTERVDSWPAIIGHDGASNGSCICYYGDRQASSVGTESVLNALVLVNADSERPSGALSQTSQKALGYLWDQQQKDGSWLWLDFGLSPWEKDGAYYGTALAAIAVGMAGKNYYERPDLNAQVDLLKKYLAARYASRPLHDQVVSLWASSWLPGILSESQKSALIAAILSAQEPDGGWSLSRLSARASSDAGLQAPDVYPSGGVSDGYATGLVVLALKRSGIPDDSPHMKRAIAWLEANEQSGTWPADYINGPRDPNSDIGGFMRDSSAAFAVLALAEPAHPFHVAGRRPC
jgi:hypothetical protein